MTSHLTLRDLNVRNKKVFLRLDLNVPIKNGVIKDDTRIRASIPTIEYLLKGGAAVVACSHLGRPKGQILPEFSLAPVAAKLKELMPGHTVLFAADVVGPDARAKAADLKPGEVLLLENVRFEPGETKDDAALAQKLRDLADLYVDDAFGAAHRANASLAAAARLFPAAAAGLLMEEELEYLSGRLGSPEHPYTAFLGGAKVSDKIPIVRGLLQKVDTMCIGGAMAYTFLVADGYAVGASRLETDLVDECRRILASARERGVRVLLPEDHLVARSLEEPGEIRVVGPGEAFPVGMAAFDIGPQTLKSFAAEAARSRTIFWNGPMGVFEKAEFAEGTLALARAVADSTALSVIGGGDSVAAVHAAGVAEKISHISTGGGASLELLAGESLPGVEALTKK